MILEHGHCEMKAVKRLKKPGEITITCPESKFASDKVQITEQAMHTN